MIGSNTMLKSEFKLNSTLQNRLLNIIYPQMLIKYFWVLLIFFLFKKEIHLKIFKIIYSFMTLDQPLSCFK